MEAIAGRIEDETPLDAVRREAEEEAGLRIREFGHVGTCWFPPGGSTERVCLYLAAISLPTAWALVAAEWTNSRT